MWYNLNLKKKICFFLCVLGGGGGGGGRGAATALMAQSRQRGDNFAKLGPTEKKICIRLFFVLMLHIKFQVPSSSCSLVLQPTKGIMDRQMGPKQYAPSTSSKLGA